MNLINFIKRLFKRKKPIDTSSFAGSSALSRDVDHLIALYPPKPDQENSIVKLTVLKSRSGKAGGSFYLNINYKSGEITEVKS